MSLGIIIFCLASVSTITVMSLNQGIAARQRYRYLRFARPPQEKQLIEARKETIKQQKASKVFRCVLKLLDLAY